MEYNNSCRADAVVGNRLIALPVVPQDPSNPDGVCSDGRVFQLILSTERDLAEIKVPSP